MSDYKFKVGDRVRILEMDEWSCKGMEANIGKIGVVVNHNDDEGINGYVIDLRDGHFEWFYMEDSLELIESKEDCNEELISKNDVLNILYGAISDETICDLIRRVRELPCK